MKNKVLKTLSTALLTACMLAGCNNNDKEVTITSVKLTGITQNYDTNGEIHWEDAKVVVNYSDNTTQTFTNLEFDVETPVNANTQCIIDTADLYGTESLEEGTYNIKVSLKENYSKYYNALSINVFNVTASKFELMTFETPDFITKYEKAIEDATKNAESSFKSKDDIFTVGTMNPFKFMPVATFDSLDGNITDFESLTYKAKYTVKEIVSNVEQAPTAGDFETLTNGIQFKDSAIGKTFKVSVQPEEFATDAFGDDVDPVSLTVDVKKGLNIYSAKELGILNNTSIDLTTNTDYAFWNCLPGIDNQQNIVANGLDKIFWDAEKDGGSYVNLNTVQLWKDYLIETKTYTTEEMNTLKDVPAVFFMNDIKLTTNDIPQEFLITRNESGYTMTTDYAVGALRDSSLLYVMPLNVDREINGNYFTLDTSSIPVSMSDTTGAFRTYNEDDKQVFAGHSCIFYFSGKEYKGSDTLNPGMSNNDAWHYMQTMDASVKSSVVKNMHSKGNCTNDMSAGSFEKLLKITGLIFSKSGYGTSHYENLILNEYMIGLFANQNIGAGNAFLGTPVAQHDYFTVDKCRIYDCANAGVFNYENGGCRIDHSELKRFGGSAVMTIGAKTSDPTSTTAFDRFYAGITKVSTDTVLENKVTGQEIYFSALGATQFIGPVKQLSTVITPFADGNGVMNLVSLEMNGSYISSNNNSKTYFSETIFDYDDASKKYSENIADLATRPMSQFYYGANYAAPTFSTNGGDIVYFDGSNYINVSNTVPPAPTGARTTPVTGDLMTLFISTGLATTLKLTFKIA